MKREINNQNVPKKDGQRKTTTADVRNIENTVKTKSEQQSTIE